LKPHRGLEDPPDLALKLPCPRRRRRTRSIIMAIAGYDAFTNESAKISKGAAGAMARDAKVARDMYIDEIGRGGR